MDGASADAASTGGLRQRNIRGDSSREKNYSAEQKGQGQQGARLAASSKQPPHAHSHRAWRIAVATAVVEDYKRRTADDARYNKIKVSLYGSMFYLAAGTLLFGLEMNIDAFDALYFSYCTLTT